MTASEAQELFPSPLPPDALAGAAKLYLDARRLKDEAEAAAAEARADFERMQEVLLEKMAASNVSSLKVGGTLLSAATREYYSVPAGTTDDVRFRLWLGYAGGQDLLKLTVNPQTLSAFCRELVGAGRALHPAVKVAQKRVIQVRGS